MKKIIISILIMGLLLNIALINVSGEKAIGKTADAVVPVAQTLDDFSSVKYGMLNSILEESKLFESMSHLIGGNSPPSPDYAPGELIVKFQEDVVSLQPVKGTLLTGIGSIDSINSKYGGLKFAERVFKNSLVPSLSNVYKFVFTNDVDIFGLVKDYSSELCVVYAEPNYIFYADVIPNDPFFSEQWGLHNTGQTGGTPDADIDAPEAWDIENGSPDVVIAIVDTGVDYTHPDLTNNIWNNTDEIPNNGVDDDNNGFVDDVRGFDFVNSEDNNGDGDYNDPGDVNDPDPLDDYGHGTHCSGIASAVTNNGVGIAGVCWNCKIMPVKGLNTKGEGYEDVLANAIIYAADNGADVISMSWGGSYSHDLIRNALDYAYSKGVVLVAAAGNSNTDLKHYPAAYDEVISVAATDHNDTRAYFSNYGKDVDIAAPGVNISSTMPTYYVIMNGYGYEMNYDSCSGTSMACPCVAGLAGLLLSKNQCPDPLGMVKTMIFNTADEINTDEYVGSGRINAYKALVRDPAIAVLQPDPSWKDNAQGIVDIEGCAWGESFQQFVLEYSRGKNPDVWIEMTSSIVPQDGVLFSWDTTQEDEGLYTIRLTVTCSDGVYTDKMWVVVNNEYNVIHVDDDNTNGPWDGTSIHPFQYIQDGIDDQGRDDMVYVHSGTYHVQHMLIEKMINLTGEDRNTTIINGGGSDFIFLLYSSWNNITGFTIKNSSIGIFLRDSDCNMFSGNVITNNRYGICLDMSSYNNISGNTIANNSAGIDLSHSCCNNTIYGNHILSNFYEGIIQWESGYSSIMENTIEDNSCGICFDHSEYNNVYRNKITGGDCGIYLYSEWLGMPTPWQTTGNTIYENNITINTIGIWIVFEGCGVPSDNTIYFNNFINNTVHNAYDEGFGGNQWDNGSVGNYWDDYKGWDLFPKDGIGDIPYKIPDGDNNPFNNNKDRYPLMKPYNGSQNSQSSQQSNPQSDPNNQQSSPSSQQINQFLQLQVIKKTTAR